MTFKQPRIGIWRVLFEVVYRIRSHNLPFQLADKATFHRIRMAQRSAEHCFPRVLHPSCSSTSAHQPTQPRFRHQEAPFLAQIHGSIDLHSYLRPQSDSLHLPKGPVNGRPAQCKPYLVRKQDQEAGKNRGNQLGDSCAFLRRRCDA